MLTASAKRCSSMSDWKRSKLTRQRLRMVFSFCTKITLTSYLSPDGLTSRGIPYQDSPNLLSKELPNKSVGEGDPVPLDLLVRSNLEE